MQGDAARGGTAGSPSLPALVGHLLDVVRDDPLPVALRLREEYGHVVRFPAVPPALDSEVYMVTHPDAVQRVLQTEAGRFGPLDSAGGRDFGRVVQDSIVSLVPGEEDGEWLDRTRLLSPEFAADAVAAHAPALAEETLATLASFSTGQVADGDPRTVPAAARVWSPDHDGVRLQPAMRRLTLRLLGISLFGADVRAEETAAIEAVDTLRSAFKRRHLDPVGRLTQFAGDGFGLPTSLAGLVGGLGAGPGERSPSETETAIERLAELADRIAARRERAPRAFDDALAAWLTRSDGETGDSLSPATLRHEVLGLLLAGHATLSAALSWTVYLLASRPSVQRRIHEEARATGLLASLPDTRASGGASVSGEAFVDSLPYTRQVWQEALRLYPTLPLFGRTAGEPVTLSGVDVPADAPLVLSPFVTQRDPEFWPSPDAFDPGRFAPDRRADRHEFAYFPFSGGPYACLGEHLATVEAVTVLATTLATHRVEFAGSGGPHEAPDVGLDWAINLEPDRDVGVRFVPRAT